MALKAYKYKIEHMKFLSMRETFEDCVRYSNATIISIDSNSAVIEIPPGGNPSMRKVALNLFINRWQSCGFKLTKL